ncbi:hypothetical protein LPTSP4_00660 [Leptospira ryugenii]|uniref:Uncharacterized protein n=1 Tax=Leptospira ryugenii TaxID=1917863 RepID=A0A2P2DVD0_9LEPT|nr:hypothetical protein LPTSP4_00660 [Leptospira ryugenii]
MPDQNHTETKQTKIKNLKGQRTWKKVHTSFKPLFWKKKEHHTE